MKKIISLTSLLALCACSAYHNGKIGMTISNPDIEFIPMEAKVTINDTNKITGSAECSSFLWVINNVPERRTYGTQLQTSDGNFASAECVAAATYDAMSKTDADVIVAPQYTTARNGLLCFGSRCLAGTTKVMVKGFSGKITSINDMDRTVIAEKQKQTKASSGASSMVSKLFF